MQSLSSEEGWILLNPSSECSYTSLFTAFTNLCSFFCPLPFLLFLFSKHVDSYVSAVYQMSWLLCLLFYSILYIWNKELCSSSWSFPLCSLILFTLMGAKNEVVWKLKLIILYCSWTPVSISFLLKFSRNNFFSLSYISELWLYSCTARSAFFFLETRSAFNTAGQYNYTRRSI